METAAAFARRINTRCACNGYCSAPHDQNNTFCVRYPSEDARLCPQCRDGQITEPWTREALGRLLKDVRAS